MTTELLASTPFYCSCVAMKKEWILDEDTQDPTAKCSLDMADMPQELILAYHLCSIQESWMVCSRNQ